MCSIQKTKVKWTISKDFIDKINKSIKQDNFEVAGSLMFKDYDCENGICNKKSSNFTLVNGNGTSVMTPGGIVNYHTHPKYAYNSENAVYGWPSGEDMGQCIRFAKNNTLVHIVFTIEGAYIIHVNEIPTAKDINLVERLFKQTHIFRSEDQKNQLKDFKQFMSKLELKYNKKTTVSLWLELANSISIKKIREIFGKEPSKNDKNIFEVNLVRMSNNTQFNAYYISENCHAKSFGKHH